MDLWLLGREPINTEKPAGSDVRYESEFEELQAEIDKLSSPTASRSSDWNKVVKLSADILSQSSKDLLVASYLAVGLLHTRQMEGFAIGLRIYLDLLDLFWEDLYPSKKRLRGRIAAIEWWIEKTSSALAQLELKPTGSEEISKIRSDLDQIDESLRRLVDEPPSFDSIRNFLDRASRTESKPSAPAPSRGPETVVGSTGGEEEAISSPKVADRVFRYGLEQIRRAATYLWQEDPKNPNPYRWIRLATWSRIEALPPSTDGKTPIPPPAPHMRGLLSDLRINEDWETLLKDAEDRLPEAMFWIDLNYYVAYALINLGDAYHSAKDAVCDETALLIRRFRGIEEMRFSDGTPFADEQTKQWLQEIGPGTEEVQPQTIPELQSSSGNGGKGSIHDEIRKARDMAKKRRLVEAVELLQEGILRSLSQREKLHWRLALSQILLERKKFGLAVPHLEQILQDIQAYRLEEWEPTLAFKCLRVAHMGFDAISDQWAKEKAAEVMSRIVRLNPAEALRFSKEK